MQVDEVRVGRIQRVGVRAIGCQHQLAVGPFNGLWGNRTTGDAVSALGVVGEHVAGQGQLRFGRGVGVAVIDRFRHIIDDVDVQRAAGHIAIGIADRYGDALPQPIGPSAIGVGLGARQGIAVTDNTGRGIVPGDG